MLQKKYIHDYQSTLEHSFIVLRATWLCDDGFLLVLKELFGQESFMPGMIAISTVSRE